jgi:hypothetical protein
MIPPTTAGSPACGRAEVLTRWSHADAGQRREMRAMRWSFPKRVNKGRCGFPPHGCGYQRWEIPIWSLHLMTHRSISSQIRFGLLLIDVEFFHIFIFADLFEGFFDC